MLKYYTKREKHSEYYYIFLDNLKYGIYIDRNPNFDFVYYMFEGNCETLLPIENYTEIEELPHLIKEIFFDNAPPVIVAKYRINIE